MTKAKIVLLAARSAVKQSKRLGKDRECEARSMRLWKTETGRYPSQRFWAMTPPSRPRPDSIARWISDAGSRLHRALTAPLLPTADSVKRP